MDVRDVCMETVIQFRLMLQKQMNPSVDISTDYDQSKRRLQVARQNLAGRRVDRVGTKANRGTGSISVLVGMVDSANHEERRRLAEAKRREADQFLDATVVSSETRALPLMEEAEEPGNAS